MLPSALLKENCFFFKGSIVKLIYFLVKSKYILEIDDNFEYLSLKIKILFWQSRNFNPSKLA